MKIKNGDDNLLLPEPSEPLTAKCAETADVAGVSRPVKRILVPVDFSECSLNALDYATGFADQLGASLTVLHVVEPAMHADNYPSVGSAFGQTSRNLLEEGRERLHEIGRKHVGSKTRSDYLVRMGRAPSEILDTAKAMGVDMIVLGTHGLTGLKQELLGGTAERVLRQAPCPVVTVRCA